MYKIAEHNINEVLFSNGGKTWSHHCFKNTTCNSIDYEFCMTDHIYKSTTGETLTVEAYEEAIKPTQQPNEQESIMMALSDTLIYALAEIEKLKGGL